MLDLLNYLVSGITGKNDLKVDETLEGDFHRFTVYAPQDLIGILIGKGGRTVRMIRSVLKVRATLEKKGVSLEILES